MLIVIMAAGFSGSCKVVQLVHAHRPNCFVPAAAATDAVDEHLLAVAATVGAVGVGWHPAVMLCHHLALEVAVHSTEHLASVLVLERRLQTMNAKTGTE